MNLVNMTSPQVLQKDLNIDDTTFLSLPEHAPQWARIQSALQHQRMTQALLLIGPSHVGISAFAYRLAALLLCHAEAQPCGACDSCQLLRAGTHPDCQIIRPEAEGGVIKIDQIRHLQDHIYQTPQCGDRLIIVIENADKMNIASANALLKALEEPPSYVHFILGAENLSTIPATLLSRTQRLVFSERRHDASDYVSLGEHYPATSNRASLYRERQSMINALGDLVEGRMSPCTIAAQWVEFPLADTLWLLYLIVAQALRMKYLPTAIGTPEHEAIARFAQRLTAAALLHHVDTLHSISKKLSHNISINRTLVLEHLLTDMRQKGML